MKSEADVTARDPEFSLAGMRFRLRTPDAEIDFHSPLVGPPHVYNTLAAVASGLALGYSLGCDQAKALEKCTGAPGRFERVPHDGDFAVVVDYAHSDDALLNVLHGARRDEGAESSPCLVVVAIATVQSARRWAKPPAL